MRKQQHTGERSLPLPYSPPTHKPMKHDYVHEHQHPRRSLSPLHWDHEDVFPIGGSGGVGVTNRSEARIPLRSWLRASTERWDARWESAVRRSRRQITARRFGGSACVWRGSYKCNRWRGQHSTSPDYRLSLSLQRF